MGLPKVLSGKNKQTNKQTKTKQNKTKQNKKQNKTKNKQTKNKNKTKNHARMTFLNFIISYGKKWKILE